MTTSRPGPARRAPGGVTRRGALVAGGTATGGVLVAACGATPPAAVDQKAAVPVTLKYLHQTMDQAVWMDTWPKIIARFQDAHPGVTVQVDSAPTIPLVAEKAIAVHAGGDYYDLMYGHFTTLATFLGADLLQPLDGFLQKDHEVKTDDFFPASMERMKGKLYGIAWFTQGKEIWYNADLVGEATSQTPRQLEKDGKWTWDALLGLAKKVAKPQGDASPVYGFNYVFTDPGTYINQLFAWGADWFDRDYTKALVTTPQFLDCTQFTVDLVVKHRVSGNYLPGSTQFPQRVLALLLGSGSNTRGWDQQIVSPNLFKIEHTMLPKGPGGRAAAMANNCMYVGQASKAPDTTWLLYKFLIGADVQPFIAQLGGGRYTASKKMKPTTVFPFEDPAVYAASAAISRATPLIVKQADLQNDWAQAWTDMIGGVRGVREALAQVQDRAAEYLKQVGCIC
jgi:multiple sugar transport system substrate-binding protein